MFGHKKPDDHYYSSKEIEFVLKNYFSSEVEKYFPITFSPFFSAYRVGRFRKAGS
jgi:hypothetical protein